MIALAAAVGAATLVAGIVAGVGLRRLPTVRLQLAGLALTAVALPLLAVSVSGLVMFHMGADVGVLVVSAAAALAAVVGALAVERSIARRLDRVRAASVQLAAGELTARAPVGGPTELAELSSSFNAMADELERLFDSHRQLLAWASHDLRAPITSLQAVLEAIEDGVVEPEHYVEALQGQVRLLAALVEDLFELACIEGGASTLAHDPVDLVALVGDCAARHAAEARACGVDLRVAARDARAVVLGDADRTDRVLENLAANALRYTPSGGHVTLSVGAGAGSVLVAVEDTGVGIPDDDLARGLRAVLALPTRPVPAPRRAPGSAWPSPAA